MNGSLFCIPVLPSLCSFGFTEKGSGKGSHQAIGIYGNGFKSGSMRLGRDALIFTKNGGCQSVGMLSQTFLHNIKAQAVIVPIAPFNQQTNILYKQNAYFILYIYYTVYALYTLLNTPYDNWYHICHSYYMSLMFSSFCYKPFKSVKKKTSQNPSFEWK